MNEMYSEVREHLRRQHAMNTQEVRGRQVQSPYMYSEIPEDSHTSPVFSFRGKVLLFLSSVMLFSLYIYGGQDVKKGAAMAFHDFNQQMYQLEKKDPRVKETMGYMRGAYHELKDFVNEYVDDTQGE